MNMHDVYCKRLRDGMLARGELLPYEEQENPRYSKLQREWTRRWRERLEKAGIIQHGDRWVDSAD